MSNLAIKLTLLLLLPWIALSALAAEQPDLQALLKQADNYRQLADSVEVETRIRLYKNDRLDKQQRYRVLIKPGRRSLVLFNSAGELGRKLLMLEDKFWMLMPKTRRPIRITPMQKLLGEASSGDIASMTWSEDYSAKLLDGDAEWLGERCHLLELNASRKGVSYERIELYLRHSDGVPRYARLYLKSGKLAKEATYHIGELDGQKMVVGIDFIDKLKKAQRTEMSFLSMRQRQIPDKYYNPAYLLRSSELE